LKPRIKRWIFSLLGKDPEAVVVTFCTGDAALCRRMADEVGALVPDRRHFVVTPENWPRMRTELRRYRIGLAPVMLADQSHDRKGVTVRIRACRPVESESLRKFWRSTERSTAPRKLSVAILVLRFIKTHPID